MTEHHLPYLSTDWLMMGFNNGLPDVGIHHLLWPNEIAEKMWPFLSAMIENMLFDGKDYVVEGEAMLPRSIAGLVKQHPESVKAAVIGYADVDVDEKVRLVKEHCHRDDDWLISQSDDYIRDHIGNMIAYSNTLRAECTTYRVPYHDTSLDFEAAIEQATDGLLRDRLPR